MGKSSFVEYNRKLACAYAYKWAFKRNLAYTDFSSMGGNCTNFVSQCLRAGEMPFNYDYPLGWYYKNIDNRSPSFTGVEFLHDFLTNAKERIGPFARVIELEEAEVGDIVQLAFNERKFEHSLLITTIEKGNENNPLLTTNSYDAINRPLSWYPYEKLRVLKIIGGYEKY